MSKAKKISKPKSAVSLGVMKSTTNAAAMRQDINVPPLDVLLFKVVSLRLPEEDPPYYAIKVTFLEQLIISAIIKPQGFRDKTEKEQVLAKGVLNYDPSDYEKMCIFGEHPLMVHIQPLKNVMTDFMDGPVTSPAASGPGSQKQGKAATSQRTLPSPQSPHSHRDKKYTGLRNISCCNIDILPLFLDTDKMCIKKRMQPMVPTKVMFKKSWDNLPLLTMGITAIRNEENEAHHKLLEDANWMKITLVGAFNMIVPFDEDSLYTAATKIPLYNDEKSTMVTYNYGFKCPRKFNNTRFYPKWESLRIGEEMFSKSDDKISYSIDDIHNPENINLFYYLREADNSDTTIWGSFHRTLMLGGSARWHWKQLRQWKWPVEVHFYGDSIGGFSFMGFADLFPLLYPGVDRIMVAVPLYWHNPRLMLEKCNCPVLLMPSDKVTQVATTATTPRAPPKQTADSATVTSTETGFNRATGADDSCAFVLMEVRFSRPLVQEVIPPYIRMSEIMDMLTSMESSQKRQCTGRGQLARDWQATVKAAAKVLRRVPHHGLTEFCNFNRQLSETRTRVEVMTSFWQDAALFVNNNFVVQNYLESDKMFEELLLMSHVVLTKMAADTLIGASEPLLDPVLRAARHSRQLRDLPHAVEMYMQVLVNQPFNGDVWRELSTCLKDVDQDWAAVCLNKSMLLDTRDPLTLLSKACMVFDEDPDGAEPFFNALLEFFPLWAGSYVIVSAYYHSREYYRLADEIWKFMNLIQAEHLVRDLHMSRSWERELGDFWDPTQLLPGNSPYLDAADLLLRIRGIRMAEVCLGLALAHTGETGPYYHLVALCCRLKGDVENALCLVRKGLEVTKNVNVYLRSLEAECLHYSGDAKEAMKSFEMVGGGTSSYSILLSLPCWDPPRVRTVLVELLRRQPSAYGWMALANDWLLRSMLQNTSDSQITEEQTAAMTCASACAVQALKFDRRAGRAWATLAKLVQPSKRRIFCSAMAVDCGFVWVDEDFEMLKKRSQESICNRFGVTLRDCRCSMCEPLKF